MIDERTHDRIDRYLRKEMSPKESLYFEQEALNDPELRREIELTYRIQRRLADREQKLRTTTHWDKKHSTQRWTIASVTSIAAMLICGFWLWNPSVNTVSDDQPMIVANATPDAQEQSETSSYSVKKVQESIDNGRVAEAIAEVEKLESDEVIPSIQRCEQAQNFTSNKIDDADKELLKDSYELHWMRILALIKLGKYAEAQESLCEFVKVEGVHKAEADSINSELIIKLQK